MTEPDVHDCLADPEGLEEQPTDRDDLVVLVCRECGRRHYEVVADPGDLRADIP